MRVLLVDDSPDATLVLSRLLTRSGHDVRVANSVLEGVVVVQEFAPDAVVVDIVLPEMDGYQAAQQLREASPNSAVRVVACSGSDPDLQRCRDARIDAFLAKPARLEDVLEAIGATN